MTNCVFCKIVAWETPSQRVYEDEGYIAFLDINPINFGHTLIIPREHIENVEATPDGVLAGMITLAKKVGLAITKAMRVDGYNIKINNGRAAGQEIDHVHIHVIPRLDGDGVYRLPARDRYPEGVMGSTAEKIKSVLGK